MTEDTRLHIHKQASPYRFHHETLAPVSISKGGSGKTKFRVEPDVYITGVGWEQVDINNAGADFYVGMYKYVQGIEMFLGYEHAGISSDEMFNVMVNLWGKDAVKEIIGDKK